MQAPQAAQECPLNEVGRIDEKHVTLFGSRPRQQRLQRLIEKFGLSRGVLGDGLLRRERDRRRATPLQAQCFFKNLRT
jgi:hypothetical protein